MQSSTTRATAKARPAMLVAALLATLPGPLAAQETLTTTDRMLLELIEEQARQIEALRQEVDALRRGTRDAEVVTVPEVTPPPPRVSSRAPEPVLAPDAAPVRPGRTGLTVSLSGQINQAVNLAADGDTTKGYFVDNDTSNSRVRIEADATTEGQRNIGSVLELAFSPNNSYDVNQDDETAEDDFLQVRRAEVYVRNDARGKLSLGQGSAAADDTAEFDLSLVAGPIMYSGVADIVGGLFFTDGDELTETTVGDAFFNFDGDRFGRVRYDSPMVGPFQLSLSAGSDQRYDAALTFGGDYGDWSGVEAGNFTMLGAIAIRDPSDDAYDWVGTGSFSTLHNPTGLSLTVAGGYGGGAAGKEPFNLYGKIGWDTDLIRFGKTGFGIDYTYAENVSDDRDEAQSIGLAVVQLIEQYGIELYSQLRWFTLDRSDGPNVDDIVVGTVGTRIKF